MSRQSDPRPDPDTPADERQRPFGVVLCAGGSSRMGRPKALLPLGSRTLLHVHLTRLQRVCSRLVVVVGAHAEAIGDVIPPGVEAVVNAAWATTHPSDSLRLALHHIGTDRAGFVVPVDTPPARPETLHRLLAAGASAVPVTVDGRPGHPVLVAPEVLSRVAVGPVPGGLRTLLGEAERVTVADPLVATDFDDPEAFEVFVARWRESG